MRPRVRSMLGLAGFAAAALVAACAHLSEPRSYVVFFQKDTTDLTPEGKQVVLQASAEVADGHPSHIVVEGRADGGTPHDATLANDRALVVIRALVDNGADAKTIENRPGAPPTGVTGVAAHQVLVTLTP